MITPRYETSRGLSRPTYQLTHHLELSSKTNLFCRPSIMRIWSADILAIHRYAEREALRWRMKIEW